MSSFRPELTPEVFDGRSAGHLPGLVGLQILTMTPQGVDSRLEVSRQLMAPNGFLHAATVIALADTGSSPCSAAPRWSCGRSRQFSAPMLQSRRMNHWFFGYFFHFPRLLAEGNG